MTTTATIDRLEATWQATADVCANLTEAQWQTATDCPGWSVHDVLAHIAGTERYLGGEPLPGPPVQAAYVKNPLGALNESWVKHYRESTGAEMLAEFIRVTAARAVRLRALTEAELDEITDTPLGRQPWRNFLPVRLLDSVSHEQDIRHALGRPANLQTPAADDCLTICHLALPRIVAKTAAAPEGSSVVIHIEGKSAAVVVDGGRGKFVRDIPAAPTTTLHSNRDTFLRLAFGRWNPTRAAADGDLRITGDLALGTRVAESLAITP